MDIMIRLNFLTPYHTPTIHCTAERIIYRVFLSGFYFGLIYEYELLKTG